MTNTAPRKAPIYVSFMLAVHTSANPAAQLGQAHWSSPAGHEVREWLIDNNLMVEHPGGYRATERGQAWVKFICSTPLPEAQWVLPKREETNDRQT